MSLDTTEMNDLQSLIFKELSSIPLDEFIEEDKESSREQNIKLVKDKIDQLSLLKELKFPPEKKKELYQVEMIYAFSTFEEFFACFPDNPVIEVFRSEKPEFLTSDIVGVIRMVTLHLKHDGMVMVEVPQSQKMEDYIKNALKKEEEYAILQQNGTNGSTL